MKKIGIYAGTFDPIHNGHLAFAETALKNGLDKVYFLVEPRPRRKQGVRALEHRVAMAKIATDDNSKLGVIHIEQARFTPHETLPLLLERFKGNHIVFLFGDDVIKHMVDNISTWPSVEKMASSASLLVAARNHNIKDISLGLKNLEKFKIIFKYDFVTLPDNNINSSEIRANIKKGVHPSELPNKVAVYALNNGLYSVDWVK